MIDIVNYRFMLKYMTLYYRRIKKQPFLFSDIDV